MNVPHITLNNGVEIPCIGNGPAAVEYTSQSSVRSRNIIVRAYNKFVTTPNANRKYVNAVSHSLQVGFTLLDYSSSYGNGSLIGEAITKSGIKRDDLFLTTRISNPAQREHKVRECLFQQLDGFGTDHVDMLMFHWPVTGYYLDTWKEMIQLYKEGYCRCLGVANCHQHHLEALMSVDEIVPAVNQIEVHPLFTQKELVNYCWSKGIHVEAYTAIARFDDRLIGLPLLKKIAFKYNKTVVQVILRWHVQNGIIPIVRSLNKTRQLENIDIFDFELNDEEMAAIDGININSRLRYDPDNCDFSIL